MGSRGLGVSSRHKRSRVSSPAHSAVVTSASRASCVPLEQHGLRLLENFVNSARNTGSNRECRVRLGSGSAGRPITQSPRSSSRAPQWSRGPQWTPQPPLDILPTCCFHVRERSPPPPLFVRLCISESVPLPVQPKDGCSFCPHSSSQQA